MRRPRESPEQDKTNKVSPPQKKQMTETTAMDTTSQGYWVKLREVMDERLKPIKDDLQDLKNNFVKHSNEINARVSKLEIEANKKIFVIRRLREEVDEKPVDTEKLVIRLLREGLQIPDADLPVIDNCVRMGKQNKSGKTNGRHVLLKVAFEKHRHTIFGHLKNLRGSDEFKDIKFEPQMSKLDRSKKINY